MEKNEITTREKLKAYFETGKYPTESQFAELIDFLRLKEDVFTNREVVTLANDLATLANGYIQYSANNIKNEKFVIVVSPEEGETQMLEIGNTNGFEKKQYFYGNAPYMVKAKIFPTEELLDENEYYWATITNNNNSWTRLFGNNLPGFPEGFEFGTFDSKFTLQINKQKFGQKINTVKTNIKFINNTEELIKYRAQTATWADIYRSENTTTDHYDLWDNLYFLYYADLREIDPSIEIVCKIYNDDNNTHLMTSYLYGGKENINIWGGGQEDGVRNISIECHYK